MNNVHRKIIDSFHPKNITYFQSEFRVMQEHRANALLFSEETMNYFQFNLNPAVVPDKCSHYAISYLLTILIEMAMYWSLMGSSA